MAYDFTHSTFFSNFATFLRQDYSTLIILEIEKI